MTDVTFLYFEECPSYDLALERLREVMREEGIQDEIEIIQVETEEQARQLGFVGSPTIRVNGRDIIPTTDADIVGLSCRAYSLDDGRISPLPSYEMIREGLRRGMGNSASDG
jgi:hypothetical protein